MTHHPGLPDRPQRSCSRASQSKEPASYTTQQSILPSTAGRDRGTTAQLSEARTEGMEGQVLEPKDKGHRALLGIQDAANFWPGSHTEGQSRAGWGNTSQPL